jgi:protein SERAC1
VLVHGLGGDRTKTWTAEDGTFWPKDFLPRDFPEARIVSFGYDSKVTQFSSRGVSQNSIENHADGLCAQLHRIRDSTKTVRNIHLYVFTSLGDICREIEEGQAADKVQTDRPIIFVAHSLGGLVCAQVRLGIIPRSLGKLVEIKI